MTLRTRFLLLGLLLLGAGLAVISLQASSEGTSVPTTDRTSTSGGAGEPLTLAGLAPPPRPSSPAPHPVAPPTWAGGPLATSGVPWLSPQPPQPRMRVRGRLLEHDGRPATAGILHVRPLGDPEATARIVWLRETAVGAEGTFEVACDVASRLEVVASTPNAHPQRFERAVAALDEVDLGDLRLEAGAVLEGRVLFGGAPGEYGPVELWVTSLGTGSRGALGMGPDRAIRPLPDGTYATSHVQTRTDASGTWRVTGLSPGPYRVQVFSIAGVLLHEALYRSTQRDATAPAREVDIDLQVSLLQVVPTTEGRAADIGPMRLDVTDAAGNAASVDRERQSGPFGLPRQPDPGRELLVAADTTVHVRVQCEGLAAWRQQVRTAAAGGTLRLAPELQRAELGVLVLSVPPQTLPAETATSGFRYRLFEPGTTFLVQEGGGRPTRETPHEAHLPVGTWDLELSVARGQPLTQRESLALPQRESVTIRASTPTRVVFDPPLGARLRVTVQGPVQGPIRCLLAEPGGQERELRFLATYTLPEHLQGSVFLQPVPLSAGRVHKVAEVLAPGATTLRFEAEGFEPYEQRLLLEAGQVHELKVTLVPR